MSTLLRRLGAHSRSILVAAVAFAVAAAVAMPAYGAPVPSVNIRVEGINSTFFSGTRTVYATTITDSADATHAVGANPLAALDLAANLGGFPYVVNDSAWGLGVGSVNGEEFVPADPWPGWLFRLNGVRLDVGADAAPLAAGDKVLWYYGTYDSSPTVAVPSARLVIVGDSLTVTAKQLDPAGVATPLADATVHVGSCTATSSVDGTITMPMNAVGDFGVRVEKAGCIRSAITTVHVRRPTSLSGPAASPARINADTSSVVSCVLKSGSVKLAGRTVRLWHRAKGSATWIAGRIKTTGPAGGVRFAVSPNRSTYYRVVFAGSPTYAPATSATTLVSVR